MSSISCKAWGVLPVNEVKMNAFFRLKVAEAGPNVQTDGGGPASSH